MRPFSKLLVAVLLIGVAAVRDQAGAEPAAYMVFELQSGRVFDQKDPFRPWYPASVTKLMTAYVTFAAIRDGTVSLKSPVIVSANALAEPASKMGFQIGTVMTVENALKMVIVKSANDIAVALGEAVSETEEMFLETMNRTARRLGMTATHFANPHGLPDPDQVTSVRDIALLSKALLEDFPQYRHLFRIAAIRFGNRRLKSANALLERYPGATGMKTGYICNSGYNIVATAERDGRTMVAVVFGATSGLERAVETAALLDKGFARAPAVQDAPLLSALRPPSDAGSLPANGYCRTAAKPSVEALLLRHGTDPVEPIDQAAPEPGEQATVKPGDQPAPPTSATVAVPLAKKAKPKKTAKLNAGELLDQLVGERVVAEAVAVSIGLPDGTTVIANVPTPRSKPAELAALQAKAEAEADPVATPGAAESGPEEAATDAVADAAAATGPSQATPAQTASSETSSGDGVPEPDEPEPAAAAPVPWPRTLGGVVIPQPRPIR